MNGKLQQIIQSLVPFLIMGIAIAMLIGLFIMFSYVLIWGIFIGGVLWFAALIKDYLFPPPPEEKHEGRVIEHKDHDKK
ncbi:hypothetical protein ACFORL_07110 [Legionella dresdenensis]|uniref:Transmembrane protein n=1 Tax=Legionella dresdenensis TaxID=450200 RepID=A0ABV8CFU1_9GAMM